MQLGARVRIRSLNQNGTVIITLQESGGLLCTVRVDQPTEVADGLFAAREDELHILEEPLCPSCGSNIVVCDAWAEWDRDKQEWILKTTFDDGYCEHCEQSTKNFDWKAIIDDDANVVGSPDRTGEAVQQESTHPENQG